MAAKAHDLMAIKTRGSGTILNFRIEMYGALVTLLERLEREEVLRLLRRQSKESSSAGPAGGSGLREELKVSTCG